MKCQPCLLNAQPFPFPFASSCLPHSSCKDKLPTDLFTFINFLFCHVATMGEDDPCAFDALFTKSVPHILEKIFFSLDYESFKTCMEVSNPWKELLTSESFKKMGASLFRKCAERELLQASNFEDSKEAKIILSRFMVDVDCIGGLFGSTPLYHATLCGHGNVVKLLLDKGADPNKEYGWTPLHLAIYKGHKDVVQLLLNGGADPRKANRWGDTPLSQAQKYGRMDIVQILNNKITAMNVVSFPEK